MRGEAMILHSGWVPLVLSSICLVNKIVLFALAVENNQPWGLSDGVLLKVYLFCTHTNGQLDLLRETVLHIPL